MTSLKPFELPPFYRFLMQEEQRRLLLPLIRLLWFSWVAVWIYVEAYAPASILGVGQLEVAWIWLWVWALVGLSLTLLPQVWGSRHPEQVTGWDAALLGVDGLFLGLGVGLTGLTYSILLIPAVMYVVLILFLVSRWPMWVSLGVLVGAGAVTQFQWRVIPEVLTTREVLWAAGGMGVIVAVSLFLVSNLRRHGVAVVRDRMYQKWLEQLNTIIFDLMPAGALVCDNAGRIRRVNPVIEPYVRELIHRHGSILDLNPEWVGLDHVPAVLSQEPVFRLSSAEYPDGRVFRVVMKPLTIHAAPPEDALYLVLLYDITDVQQREQEAEIRRRWSSFQNISAGLVHEIRNPLGAIMGVIETVLGSDELSATDKEKMVSMVRYEGERMNTLVQDFLDSLQTDMVLNRERHDIRKICEDFYQLASKDPKVKAHQVSFTFHNRLKGNPKIEVDKDRLIQVLHNLFQNAVQAVTTQGDPASGIILELEDDGKEWVVVRFIDHGGGIAPEVMQRMFDPFFTTKEKGTGLGLSISYRIIEAHHGKLTFHSRPGRPTRAEIWLPR